MAGPLTQASQTAQSFADISLLLRECTADAELHLLRDHIGALAKALDMAVGARRHRREPNTIARRATVLAQEVRRHQTTLGHKESGWQRMYEWTNYQRTLRELAQAVQHWRETLAQRSSREGAAFDQMEQLAWRTLGEGLLLMDMYQQGTSKLMELEQLQHLERYPEQDTVAPTPTKQSHRTAPAAPWWRRLWQRCQHWLQRLQRPSRRRS